MTSAATKSRSKATKKATTSVKPVGAPTEQKMSIFQAIAGLERALERPVPRNLVSVYSGKADKTVKNELSKLKNKGHIVYNVATISVTSSGRLALGSSIPTIAMSQDAATARMKSKLNLNKKECIVLDILSDGRAQLKTDVMKLADFNTHKTFANTLCKLKKLEIVEYTDKNKSVQLTDKMFPFGRPHTSFTTATSSTKRFEILDPADFSP